MNQQASATMSIRETDYLPLRYPKSSPLFTKNGVEVLWKATPLGATDDSDVACVLSNGTFFS